VIRAMNEKDWEAAIRIMPMTLKQDIRGIASVDPETDELWGCVICEDWTVTSVSCHIIVEDRRAFRDGLHKEAADYVFNQAERIRMLGTVPADNEAALKLNKHLGFKEIFRIKEGYDWGIDYVIMELMKEDCPYWVPRESMYGQESSEGARLRVAS
jgi:ribosomal protein S18 acetylase RimI-like enzyme